MSIRDFARLLAAIVVICMPFAVNSGSGSDYALRSINLAWDPSSDSSQVAGYILHLGTNSGNYIYTNVLAGTQTVVSVIGVFTAPKYFFAVKAYDTNGLKSDFSNEAIYTNALAQTTNNLSQPSDELMNSFTVVLIADTNHARRSINLAWDSSSDGAQVAGYIMNWGTSSGNYIFTNVFAGTQTVASVTGVFSAPLYFFAVKAFDANGLESDFSNEAIYTNGLSQKMELLSALPNDTNIALLEPKASSTNIIPMALYPKSQTISIQQNSAPVNGDQSLHELISCTNIIGIPPGIIMEMYPPPKLPTIKGIWGTHGATVLIQTSPTLDNPNSWTTVTSIVLTNSIPLRLSTNSMLNLIDEAFVPAWQDWVLPQSYSGDSMFYKVVMAYDYPIVADLVLRSRGYSTRLITIRMPGIVGFTVCYVTQASSYIVCNMEANIFELVPSGSKIREIATTVAESLKLNWTSATEFEFTNGVCQALATVVKTDDPVLDAVVDTTKSSIQINF